MQAHMASAKVVVCLHHLAPCVHHLYIQLWHVVNGALDEQVECWISIGILQNQVTLFLGVLAGLDPNREEFATLLPHWKLDYPMSNDRIKEAMNLIFVTILQRWGSTEVDPTGILLSFLQQLCAIQIGSKKWQQNTLGICSV